MLYNPFNKYYCPALRLKMGEYKALAALAENIKDHVLPYIIAPPSKDRDPEHGRLLTCNELFSETARRISNYWPLRPSILDTSYVSSELGLASAHEWLPKLYKHIADLHGNCIPALNFSSSSSERLGIREVYKKQGKYIAIRVPISYIEDPMIFKKIYDIVNVVGCGAEKTFIVLDCEDMALDPVADTILIIENALSIISSLGAWGKIIFVATSYPDRNPADQNGYYRVERHEIQLWRIIRSSKKTSFANIMYGDYGADCALIDFSSRKGGRTIPHLRLTDASAIHVFRGGRNLGKHDDGTIRSVAQRVVASPYFDTPVNSAAEEFIIDCAEHQGRPGNATTWREVNTVRHITSTVDTLLKIDGTVLPDRPRRSRLRQTSLLDQN